MRYGIFSDIHGNLEAFEAVTKAFAEEKIDQYYCLGDIVGYGANPNECIEKVKELKAVTVAGNHDWAVLGKLDTTYFNPAAKKAVDWTQSALSENGLKFLEELPLEYSTKEFILVHGTLQESEKFHYLFYPEQADEMFRLMDRPVAFIGHTHVPMIVVLEQKKIKSLDSWEITLNPENKYIINVGSVGQPRDSNPLAAYCIYDSQDQTISIKRIQYPIKEAQKKIIDAGLPSVLASRLSVGQ